MYSHGNVDKARDPYKAWDPSQSDDHTILSQVDSVDLYCMHALSHGRRPHCHLAVHPPATLQDPAGADANSG